MTIDRRSLLLSLASAVPLAAIAPFPGLAQDMGADVSAFLRVSKVITGRDGLDEGTAQRIAGLLASRDAGFSMKLLDLDQAFTGDGSRSAQLAGLNDTLTDFALEIARPWYLGFVGTPSGRVLKDDAEFATFLQAQAYTEVADIVPLTSYPPSGAGWWSAVPKGVDASDLDPDAASWAYQPRETYQIEAPDPAWRAYASGQYDSIEAAQTALGAATGQGDQ